MSSSAFMELVTSYKISEMRSYKNDQIRNDVVFLDDPIGVCNNYSDDNYSSNHHNNIFNPSSYDHHHQHLINSSTNNNSPNLVISSSKGTSTSTNTTKFIDPFTGSLIFQNDTPTFGMSQHQFIKPMNMNNMMMLGNRVIPDEVSNVIMDSGNGGRGCRTSTNVRKKVMKVSQDVIKGQWTLEQDM